MNSNDFLKEGIGEDAHAMALDHEVQMARQECYHAAENAIALHKLLRHMSEQQGLEGWVSAKITLAADYLETVRKHLEYQLMSGAEQQEPISVVTVAENVITQEDLAPVTEANPHHFDSDEDYYAAQNARAKPRYRGQQSPGVNPDDEDYFREIWRKKREAAKKAEQDGEQGVAEGEGGNYYSIALQMYPQLKQFDRATVITALNNAYEDYLMHYGYEGIGPDEERSMINRAIKGLKQGVAEAGEWTKLPNGNWRNMHTGAQQSTPPKTKKPRRTMGLHTSLEQHADDKMKELGHKFKGVAEEAGTKGFRVTWSEAGSDKHTSGLLLKRHAIEHAKMLKKKPGTSNVKVIPYRSVEEDEAKLKAYKRASAGDAINRQNIARHTGKADPKIAKRNAGQERAEKRLGGISQGISETSAGSVAGVVAPVGKNKAKVGSLFGGTYKQKKAAK